MSLSKRTATILALVYALGVLTGAGCVSVQQGEERTTTVKLWDVFELSITQKREAVPVEGAPEIDPEAVEAKRLAEIHEGG